MNINLATQRLIDEGESAIVQFVSSMDSLPKIINTVCGFLNGKGGTVVVGFDGNECLAKLSKADAAALRKQLYNAISPNCVMSVSLDEIVTGNVLVVDVPNGRDTPYVVNGQVFVRRGKSTVAASSEEIREMVLEKGTQVQRWERRPSPTLSESDLADSLIKKTVDLGIDKKGFNFENPRDQESVLEQLELLTFGQYTNGADVLYGAKVAQRLPQTRVRAVRYESDRMGDFVDYQLFEGPALEIFQDIMAFFKRNISVASEFVPGQAERNDIPDYPFNSIREGVINALVHRDYSAFSGSIKISIYPDRLEIWNSGKLPKGITAKKLEMAQHDSILVNPDISHVFHLHGHMERVGRGTYNMVRECRAFGMKTPEWKNVTQGVRLTFFSQRLPLEKEFNNRQMHYLETAKEGAEITTVEYREEFAAGVSPRHARRDLEKLEDYGFLLREGVGRATIFTRTGKGL